MKKPVLKVRKYRHSATHPFLLDLRAFGKGRKFFRFRAEAEAERLRELTSLERYGREAVGLPQREMSDFITAKRKLAEYGQTINDAVKFFVDHLERVRRCKITASQLADEVIDAKRRDGMSDAYLSDLKLRLTRFCRDFGHRPIASYAPSPVHRKAGRTIAPTSAFCSATPRSAGCWISIQSCTLRARNCQTIRRRFSQ
jgi:hypothetical protein